MKKIGKLLYGFLLFVVLAVAIGCTKDSVFKVTFNANGGVLTSDASVEVVENEKLTEPTAPTRDDYEFDGWYLSDDEGVTLLVKWDFATREVKGDFTLYAKWNVIEGKIQSIESILENSKDKEEVYVGGTIYFIETAGLYISDSNLGKIFVQTATSGKGYEVGKKVEVKGKFDITGGQRKIIATSVEAKGDGTTVSATSATIKTLSSLSDADKKGSWYTLATTIGTIEYNEALMELKIVSDDTVNSIIIDDKANINLLKARAGERIELKVILTGYDSISNLWRAQYIETSVKESQYTIAELKSMVEGFLDENVRQEITGGGLSLPAVYQPVQDVTITWTTDLTTLIEILPLEEGSTEYLTNVEIPDADTTGKLTAEVKYKDNDPFTIELDIKVKTLVKTTLKEAIAEKAQISLFDAVVVGFAAGQNITFKSYIVQDLSDPNVIISVDYYGNETDGFGSYINDVKVGDVLTFVASFRESGRPCFNEVSTTKTDTTQDPVYDFENAPVLNAETWGNFPGYNKFVKLENPYMRYSTSTAPAPTNWVRLGYAEDNVGVNFGIGNNKTLAFLIRPLDELMGKSWRDGLNIPVTTGTPIMYDGDIYGYVLYESDTYFQFVAVNTEHFVPSHRLQVIEDLDESLPARIEEGDLTLPTTHKFVDGAITWTSSLPDIISATGVITYPHADTAVTLTASYKVDNVEGTQTHTIEILVIGQERIVLEVDEALELTDGEFLNVGGLVLQVGYTTSTAGTSQINTIFLQDRTSGKVVIVTGLEALYAEDTFEIGADIEFSGKIFIDGERFTIVYETDLRVNSENNTLLDYKETALTSSTHEEALELFNEGADYGQVYHFAGPIWFNSTTTSGRVTNLRFHLNAAATDTASIQYGGKSLVFNVDGNIGVIGKNFLEDLFGFTDNPGTARPGTLVEVDLYFVILSSSASYYYAVLLSADDVVAMSDNDIIEGDIRNIVPTEMISGDISLPTTHELLTADIAWTSNNTEVISNAGVVKYPNEETTVTLIAKYTLEEVEYTFYIDILVKPVKVNSVADVITDANDGDVVLVEGIIVGFHWNGSSTINSETNGIIIKDLTGNEVLYVTGIYESYGDTRAQFVVGEHTLAKGDKIKFVSTYQVSTTEGHVGRNTLAIQSAEIAQFEVVESNVEYTFDLDSAEVISNQEELAAVAEDLTYGKLYKLTGDFGFRGSAGSYGTGVNLQISYVRKDASDYNMPVSWDDGRGQRFSIKFDGNVPNLGELWYEDLLGINSTTYTGTSNSGMTFEEGASIYFYVGNALSKASPANGYIQLVVLDPTWITATLKTVTE